MFNNYSFETQIRERKEVLKEINIHAWKVQKQKRISEYHGLSVFKKKTIVKSQQPCCA